MTSFSFEKRFRDQVLACSRCGYCGAGCPVFALTLRPSYSARGKMLILKEVMAGTVRFQSEFIETLFQCTGCGSCLESCPTRINVPEILKQAKKDMVNLGLFHPGFDDMKNILSRNKNIYAQELHPDFHKDLNREADCVYFAGCVGLYRERGATVSVLRLLDYIGINYTLVDEVCCSGVLEDIGYEIDRDHAKKNIDVITATRAGTLITGCPFCYRTFREKDAYEPIRKAGISILHISQFLKEFEFGVKTEKRVTYHDPCDLGRHSGIFDAPRETIRKVAPNFVEMPHSRRDALCCGAGGGMRAAYPKNSIAIARRRLAEAEQVGAEILLTDCPSCIHNLSNAKRQRQSIKILTTSELICDLLQDVIPAQGGEACRESS